MSSATQIVGAEPDVSALILATALPSPPLSVEKAEKWAARISSCGPWDEAEDPISLAGVSSLPMPVQVSEPALLAPFFTHLRDNGTHLVAKHGVRGAEPYYNSELVEFGKGVLYDDGRVDLCKMVTGPRNIGDLMDALKTNTFAKHFLLGNNIIGPVGAKAIADFIYDRPDRIETWYLAGNCIDTTSFSLLVDAMTKSSCVTNIWLKRNPLRPEAAKQVFRLVTQCRALRTLDLDQTELGDIGIAELFSLMADHDKPLPLRHLYLNGNGISYTACTQLARYLASQHCALTSLYMSQNPIGDAAALLAPGIKCNRTLCRLTLQSCGLKDAGTVPLLEAMIAHPTMRVLDLGQAYATEDLGVRWNWLSSDTAHALIKLIASTPLQYLNVSYTPMPAADMHALLKAAGASESLLWFYAMPLVKGGRTKLEIRDGLETSRLRRQVRSRSELNVGREYDGLAWEAWEVDYKRFLVSPRDVRFIDSVYRNRDAGLARRGIKRLDKWWSEGDETLRKAQEGIVD